MHTCRDGLAKVGELLDSYWINFTGFNAADQKITGNPVRTVSPLWIVIR